MKKFISIEGLAKGFAGLAGHFTKAAAHHEAMHKAHAGHAIVAKAKHDGMDDGDVHKAYFKAVADHHEEMAKLHKAHADHHAEMAKATGDEEDGDKAVKAAAAAAAAVTEPGTALNAADLNVSVGNLMKDTVAEAVKSLKEDSSFKDLFKAAVLEEVKRQLGQQLEPTDVKVIIPSNVPGAGGSGAGVGVIPIARPGSAPLDTSEVPATLLHLVDA